MISTKLMYLIMSIYFIIGLSSLLEKNWPRAMYWFAALQITFSVVWMGDFK